MPGTLKGQQLAHIERKRSAPPAEARRELRKEVEFGCPVDDWGSPYLTWHHFDPPWREERHHRVAGMVALCLQHHKEADVGAFTVEQLREFKAYPFLRRSGSFPGGRFNWKREQQMLQAGGGLYFRCPTFLESARRPVVWISEDAAGFEVLNLDLWDERGQLAFSMRENDWLVLDEIDDLECPPSGRSLILRAPNRGIRLSVGFDSVSRASVRELLLRREKQVDQLMSDITSGWDGTEFVSCTLGGSLPYPVPIRITDSRIILSGNIEIVGGVMVANATAISVS